MNPEERRAEIKNQMKVTNAKPAKKPYTIKYPWTLETTYAQAIKRYQKQAIMSVNKVMSKALPDIIAQRRRDLKLDAYGDEITKAVNLAIQDFNIKTSNINIEAYSARYGNDLAAYNAKQMGKSFNAGLGLIPIVPEPWLVPMLEEFVTFNASLIKSVPTEYFAKVETALRVNVSAGMSVETTRKALHKAGVQSYNRAQLIARDQTGKFFSQLTKQRNEAIGLTSFIWHHSGLANPREEHIANDGHSFKWSQGDAQGDIPGSAINCRCSSTADFSVLD